ncbi:MAG: alpha/beta hydrolase [Nitrospirota bacterium]|nr:alpha/beta hydrolase [Nitrospirota bacterium]MDH5587629.1 alpha/beta hydrolase [Nitrospirota bacterium]MDH5775619.1 alpha/beta hydrolase [Nitrospirota bacterium]
MKHLQKIGYSPKDILSQCLIQLNYRYILVVIMCFLFSGCPFQSLEKDLAFIRNTARLQGTIVNPSPHQKPIIVLAYQLFESDKKLVTYSVQHRPGTFTFIRSPGRYLIAAFEDANEDWAYQPTEYAGYVGNGSIITVKPGEDIVHLDLTLKHPEEVTLAEAPDLASPAIKAQLDFSKIQAGEIVAIGDLRFSQKNGKQGLWEPVQFLREVGGGVFFLEPFDPQKIPVVFVHGAGGNPSEWSSLIDHLDRTRYQPWVFYYPSGLRLNLCAEFLVKTLRKVLVGNTLNNEKIVVIAHSMGGLVSRSLVNMIVEKDVEQKIRVLFLTISTPWGGHEAAQMGVDYAPAVIPSWIDMIPNSPYQQALFQTPLSSQIDYYLFFGFKGGRNPFTGGNDDGTVSLASQLKPEAQDAALKTIGFNEDHVSILRSPSVAEKFVTLLTTFANRE